MTCLKYPDVPDRRANFGYSHFMLVGYLLQNLSRSRRKGPLDWQGVDMRDKPVSGGSLALRSNYRQLTLSLRPRFVKPPLTFFTRLMSLC